MKKFIPSLFALSLPFQAHALYLGNPAEPQIMDQGFFFSQDALFTIKVGYQGDFVLNRRLRAEGPSGHRIDRFEYQMNQGVITFNFLDRLEAYGSVGAFNTTFWHRPPPDSALREVTSHDSWTAGGGLRALLMQWGHTALGIDAKFQYGRSPARWISVSGVGYGTHAHLTYREWQTGIAVSHTIDWFTPYIGATYSNVHADINGLKHSTYPYSHFKMRNPAHFGLVIGCTLSSGKKFDLTGEAHMVDELAFSLTGNLKF